MGQSVDPLIGLVDEHETYRERGEFFGHKPGQANEDRVDAGADSFHQVELHKDQKTFLPGGISNKETISVGTDNMLVAIFTKKGPMV